MRVIREYTTVHDVGAGGFVCHAGSGQIGRVRRAGMCRVCMYEKRFYMSEIS